MGAKRFSAGMFFLRSLLVVLVMMAGVSTVGAAEDTETASTGDFTYLYTQATSIVPGEKYVIVDADYPFALMDENGKMEAQNVEVSGQRISSQTRLTEWTFSDSKEGTVYDGQYYLGFSGSQFVLNSTNRNAQMEFSCEENESSFRIQREKKSLYYHEGYGWRTSGAKVKELVCLYRYIGTTAGENSGQTVELNAPYTVLAGECLDLRGCHIEGTVTVEEGGCIIDTATDAFDADVAGSISDYTGPSVFSPAETSSAHGKHYVTIPVNDADGNRIKTEFHRVAVSATAFRFALSKGQIYLSVEAKFRGSVTDDGVCAGLEILENIGFEINETINETKTAVPGSMYQDSGQAITSLIPDSENTLAVHFSFLANLDAVYTIRAKLCFSGVSALSTERTIDLREVLTSAQKEFQLQADDETLEPDVRSSARNSAAVIGRYLGT